MPTKEGKTMANWYKSYETGLDEERLIYVLAEEPLALSVWVWILTQCCKDRRGNISMDKWIKRGATHKLNINEQVFDTALNLLNEVNYIAYEDGKITVLQWENRQSDYCNRIGVRTPTVDSTSRGEEKRREKRRVYSKGFNEFWNYYPRKQNKGKAMDAWTKMGCEKDVELIIQAIQSQNKTVFRDKEIQFIPLASSWINGERWDDETSSETKPKEARSRWHS